MNKIEDHNTKKSWPFLLYILALTTSISLLSSCSKTSKHSISDIIQVVSASSKFPKYANLTLGISIQIRSLKKAYTILTHEIKNTHLYNKKYDTRVDFEIKDSIPKLNGRYQAQILSEPIVPGKFIKFLIIIYKLNKHNKPVIIDTAFTLTASPVFGLISRYIAPNEAYVLESHIISEESIKIVHDFDKY